MKFCICSSSATNNSCDTNFNTTLNMYPGQKLTLHLAAKDYKGTPIATIVQVYMKEGSGQDFISFLNKNSCTPIMFTRRDILLPASSLCYQTIHLH